MVVRCLPFLGVDTRSNDLLQIDSDQSQEKSYYTIYLSKNQVSNITLLEYLK